MGETPSFPPYPDEVATDPLIFSAIQSPSFDDDPRVISQNTFFADSMLLWYGRRSFSFSHRPRSNFIFIVADTFNQPRFAFSIGPEWEEVLGPIQDDEVFQVGVRTSLPNGLPSYMSIGTSTWNP